MHRHTAQPELVEGLSFSFFPLAAKKKQGFDKLSLDGS